MDFVQRNLINERNNLQVELAKAKALIAELSEAATLLRGMEAVKRKSEMSGKKLPTEEEARQALKALQIKKEERANAASSGMGTRIKRPNAFKRNFNEEAEYISELENVIIAIAEQLGVHPNDLLNEVNVHINMQDTSMRGPYNPNRDGERRAGISNALLNDPSQRGVNARAAHRQAEQGAIDARAAEYQDHKRRMGGYPKPT